MPDTNGNSFRNAGFGGFNKKDVVAYIQEQTRKYTKQISTLEKSLNEAVTEKKELQVELSATKVELDRMTLRVNELEEKSKEFSTVKKTLEEKESKLQNMQEELEKLRNEVTAVHDLQAKLEGEKAALVQMEMDARFRADKLETDARDKAELLANRYTREVADAISVFTHFKANADTMILSANEQLQSILTLFSEMEKELMTSGQMFENLANVPQKESL